MRILEICTSAWPMPDMQMQIDALREAFSADTSKPFKLKSTFPYGSPGRTLQPSPPLDLNYQHHSLSQQGSQDQTAQVQFHSEPMTPPISTGHNDQDRSLASGSLAMMTNGGQQPILMATNTMGTDQTAWDPTRIFQYGSEKKKVKSSTDSSSSQWNTAFETPSNVIDSSINSISQPSPPLYTPSSLAPHDLPPLNDTLQQQQPEQYSINSSMAPLSRIQSIPSRPSYTSVGPSFVTSSMWRDTVASTYDPSGLKRRWDMEPSYLIDPVQSKRSR